MDKNTVIVSLHGIMTPVQEKNGWQEAFGNYLKENYPDVTYIPIYYGLITPTISWLTTVAFNFKVKFIINWIKKLVSKKFKDTVVNFLKENPNAKLHVIAHSFGTWISHEFLIDNPEVKIQSLTLVAGVISAHIEKNYLDEMLNKGQIKACFTWGSHKDMVVRAIALPPFGHLGYWNIITDDPQDRISPKTKPYLSLDLYNIPTNNTHTGYWDDPATYFCFCSHIKLAESL